MTQLTEHARAILRAIADGKQIEHLDNNGVWESIDIRRIFNAFTYADGWSDLRIKPETRSINGVEFGAPVSKSGGGDWAFSDEQMRMLRTFGWTEEEDRDIAYQTIVDALEGDSK